MRRATAAKAESARSRFAALLSRLGLWLAAFALLSQSIAVAAAPAYDAFAASQDLRAWLGPSVVVCVHDEAPSTPADSHDHCPLCGLAAAAFDAPAPPPLPAAPRRLEAKLALPPPTILFAAGRVPVPLARGPPART